MALTPEQKLALEQGIPLRNGVPVESINSASLSPTESLQIPPETQPLNVNSILSSFIQEAQSPAPEEQKQITLGDEMARLVGQSLTPQELQVQEDERQGVAGFKKKYQEVGGAINALTNQARILALQAQDIPVQQQSQATGRGITAGGLSPITTAELQNNQLKQSALAAQALQLQSAAFIAQGDLALAQEAADKAVEARFAVQERDLNRLKLQYEMNRDALERYDKKRATALGIAIDERERLLNEEKADRQFTSNLMLQAVQAGAPSNIAKAMSEATPEEAISIGASYLGAEFKRKAEQQAFENSISLRSLGLQEASAERARRKDLLELAKSGDKAAITALGYDPNNLPLTTSQRVAFEEQQALIQKDLNITSSALRNNIGMQRASGIIRGAIASFFFEPGGYIAQPYGMTKEQNFLADASYIIKNLTFNKIKELATMGVKLTPISEKELKAMGDASAVLTASAEFDNKTGALTGFNLSEKRVREELQNIQTHYQNAIADIDKEIYLSPQEQETIINK